MNRHNTPLVAAALAAAGLASAGGCTGVGVGSEPGRGVTISEGDGTNVGDGGGSSWNDARRKPGRSGYSTAPLYRTDIRTVAIEMFGSREYRRQWEFRLTEAVAKQLELKTPWRLGHASTADAVLTGEVVSISGSTLSEAPDTGAVREFQLGIAIRWRLKDLRTGRILHESAGSFPELAFAFQYPQFNESQNNTLDAAVDAAARRVVAGLREDF